MHIGNEGGGIDSNDWTRQTTGGYTTYLGCMLAEVSPGRLRMRPLIKMAHGPADLVHPWFRCEIHVELQYGVKSRKCLERHHAEPSLWTSVCLRKPDLPNVS